MPILHKWYQNMSGFATASESHNTRLSGMKQDCADFKNDFNSSFSCLKNSIDQKFNSINSQLDQIEGNIQKNITDIQTLSGDACYCTCTNPNMRKSV